MRIAIPELLRAELEGWLPSGVATAWYRDTSDVAAAADGADVFLMGFVDADDIKVAIEAQEDAKTDDPNLIILPSKVQLLPAISSLQ